MLCLLARVNLSSQSSLSNPHFMINTLPILSVYKSQQKKKTAKVELCHHYNLQQMNCVCLLFSSFLWLQWRKYHYSYSRPVSPAMLRTSHPLAFSRPLPWNFSLSSSPNLPNIPICFSTSQLEQGWETPCLTHPSTCFSGLPNGLHKQLPCFYTQPISVHSNQLSIKIVHQSHQEPLSCQI